MRCDRHPVDFVVADWYISWLAVFFGVRLFGLSHNNVSLLRARLYVPTKDDIGHILQVQVSAMDAAGNFICTQKFFSKVVLPGWRIVAGRQNRKHWLWHLYAFSSPGPRDTKAVKSRCPNPPSSVGRQIESVLLQRAGRGFFRLFCFIDHLILLRESYCFFYCFRSHFQIYTNKAQYPYCPLWALHWNYRHQNLMREMKQYAADIYCLQVGCCQVAGGCPRVLQHDSSSSMLLHQSVRSSYLPFVISFAGSARG